MENIYFSCNIIIFDSYQLPINKSKKENISSKSQIENNYSKKSQSQIITTNTKNKINFLSEKNINLYNSFMNREIEYFPIIRIFGTTKSGQKCCVNIHNYFPYFYIGITKDNYFNYNNKDTLQAFAVILEKTFVEYRNEVSRMALFKNDEKDSSQIVREQEEQVIHNITPVFKTNIYGYYKKESVFLKVECYNPGDIKDLMYVLNQGSVNNNFYQCYDAHISYSTHFFGDYHLFGMGTIKIKNFSFREGIPDKGNDIDFNKKYTFFENNI